MKNKKILLIIIIAIILVCLLFIITKNIEIKTDASELTEITPSAEVTEEQERQTMIALYYTNIETNTLVPEAKVIDAKNLLENPYKTLMEYLIQSPKNEKLKSSIPEGTKINGVNLSGDMIIIDLSKEFIEGQTNETANLSIYAVVNTLTELNEVNFVKILIDGEEDVKIPNTDIVLSEVFSRVTT